MRLMLSAILLVFWWLGPAGQYTAFAQPNQANACSDDGQSETFINTLSVTQPGELRPLSSAYFVDETGLVDTAGIAGQTFLKGFCNSSFPVPASGGALWLRFQVTNSHVSAQTWIIGMVEIFVDELLLYESASDGLSLVARNGRSVPPKDRPVSAVRMAVPFEIGAGESKLLYLRVSGTLAPTATPVLVSEAFFGNWSAIPTIIGTLMLCFFAMMALFSLIFFRHIDPRFCWYYVLYMASRFAFTLFYNDWFAKATGIIVPISASIPVSLFIGGGSTLAVILFCFALFSTDTLSRLEKLIFWVLLAVGTVIIGMTVLSPQTLLVPLFLFNSLTPLVLFVVSAVKYKNGLIHAKWICAGLAALMFGLSLSVFGFLFPVELTTTTSGWDLVLARPLKLAYIVAVFVEPICMMIALSAVVRGIGKRQDAAVAEAALLRSNLAQFEDQTVAQQKSAQARILALEALVQDDPESTLLPPAEKQIVDNATKAVLENIELVGFGARELAQILGTSEKTLGRRLKASLGLSPAAFIRSIRLTVARDLIVLRQHSTVAEVAYATGFSSVSHFAKLYRREFSETPSEALTAAKASE